MRPLYNRQNIVLGSILVLLILVAFGFFSYRSEQRTVRESINLDNTLRSLHLMEDLKNDMQDIESSQRGYVITRDSSYLAPYNKAVASLQQDTVDIREVARFQPFRGNDLNKLIRHVRDKVLFSDSTIAYIRYGNLDSAFDRVRSGVGKRNMDSIRSILDRFEQMDNQELKTANAKRQAAASSTIRWVITLVLSLFLGMIILTLRVLRDLRLKEENEKKILYLASLAEKTSDAIISVNDKGAIRTWNQGASSIFGCSEEKVLNRNISLLTKKELDLPALAGSIKKGPSNLEWICYASNGEAIPCLVSITALSGNGDDPGYVLVLRDIKDRKRNEELLEKFNEELNRQVVEKTREKLEADAKYREELRKLNGYLQLVREEERTKISREVHDELGQQLTVLKMGIYWLSKKMVNQDKNMQEKISDLMEMIDGTVRSVRRISAELRPGILDDLGLQAAIEWQAQEFEKHSGIKVETDLSINDVKLPGNIAITLFRIFQESLTNIARHAEATRAMVRLSIQDHMIQLLVEDNGKGFSPQQAGEKGTLGLLGMKERAVAIRGELEMIAEPGKGTMVKVVAPLN